jgi:hypothetical protein
MGLTMRNVDSKIHSSRFDVAHFAPKLLLPDFCNKIGDSKLPARLAYVGYWGECVANYFHDQNEQY